MTTPQQGALLRVYVGEDERDDGHPLYETLVLRARELGLAGATVLRGPLGYGHDSRLHTAKILRLSQDLPCVVEIIDERAAIDRFVEAVRPMLGKVLATVEPVEIVNGGPARP